MNANIDLLSQDFTVSESITRLAQLTALQGSQSDECEKLKIIQRIEQKLLQKLGHPCAKPCSEPNENSYFFFNSFYTTGVYSLFISFGFFEKSIGSFLFGSTFFALIPGLPPSILLGISILYTLLDAILFYAFEVSFLQKMMGLPVANASSILNETLLLQLKAVTSINEILARRVTLEWNQAEYNEFCQFRDLCNKDLLAKQEKMDSYPRVWSKLILEYFIIVFGAISSMADSYFMAKAAIIGLHLSLTGPLGIMIALAMVLSGLGFYYAMGAKSVGKLVNPDRKSFNSLQKNLNFFKETLPPVLMNETEDDEFRAVHNGHYCFVS